MIKDSLVSLIQFYRNYLSILKLPACRYYPTCSQYAIDSLEKYGLVKGFLKASYRVLRCNPLFTGGYDPA